MAKRIFLIVAALMVGSALFYVYQRHRVENRFNNGEVATPDPAGRGEDTASDNGDGDAANSRQENGSKRQAGRQAQVTSTVPASMMAGSASAGSMAAPATDSLLPNPPNGAAFSGTGRYQVYRQGNLTWRVNTDDGKTCILFATDEEWRKPIVYSHGCRNS